MTNPVVGGSHTPGGLELSWYDEAAVTLQNGALYLTAIPDTSHPGFSYTSGMISTGGTTGNVLWSFQYGYAEVTMQVPPGLGMWPAAWLVPANGSWPPEIDIMEGQNADPNTVFMTYHWSSTNQQQQFTYLNPAPLSAGFHAYAVDWEPGSITWYVDRVARGTYTNASTVTNLPMYIIVDLAIGGWVAPADPNASTVFPASLVVQSVQVWNKRPF